jgi:hypothetical protein
MGLCLFDVVSNPIVVDNVVTSAARSACDSYYPMPIFSLALCKSILVDIYFMMGLMSTWRMFCGAESAFQSCVISVF